MFLARAAPAPRAGRARAFPRTRRPARRRHALGLALERPSQVPALEEILPCLAALDLVIAVQAVFASAVWSSIHLRVASASNRSMPCCSARATRFRTSCLSASNLSWRVEHNRALLPQGHPGLKLLLAGLRASSPVVIACRMSSMRLSNSASAWTACTGRHDCGLAEASRQRRCPRWGLGRRRHNLRGEGLLADGAVDGDQVVLIEVHIHVDQGALGVAGSTST